jgi:uncharacterized membrane protein
MIRFASEQTIDRSADEIWAFASDITRHPEWMGVMDAVVVSGRSQEVGAIGRETVRMGPRRFVAEFVVSESSPGRVIAWRVGGRTPIVGEARLELDAAGPNSTRVRWSGGFSMTGLWRLLEPLMAGEIRAGEAAELVRLKTALEAPATAPAMA